jgi:hypothetical protein
MSMLGKTDVVNAYKFILGREPENDEAINYYLTSCKNIMELRDVFLRLPEFLEKKSVSRSIHEYSGITTEDFSLLEKYLCLSSNNEREACYLTDFMGAKHSVTDLPFIKNRDGDIVNEIPVPDDSFHAESIEYVALFTAVEDASDVFTMFEFGAGWGPWMVAAGIACKKRGNFKSISLTGVEGEPDKIHYIKRHLIKNALMRENADLKSSIDNVHTAIYEGVVNVDGSTAKFPLVSGKDYDASLMQDTSVYCRSDFIEVPGYTPAFLFSDYDFIDFVHVDIQGYESVLFFDEKVIEDFRQKVKYICIGTHSRKIEGDLMEYLYGHNFQLIREKPCRMHLPQTKPGSFIDITTMDGTQIWRNLANFQNDA